jgi:hypothetical protein
MVTGASFGPRRGCPGGDLDVDARRLEPHADAGGAPQVLLEDRPALGHRSLGQDLPDPGNRLLLGRVAEAQLVLLVDGVELRLVRQRGLLVHFLLEQRFRRDPAFRRLRGHQPLRDHLLERLAAHVVLLLPQARQPVCTPLFQLARLDGRAVHLGDDAVRRPAARCCAWWPAAGQECAHS